jgi:alpha-L-fucosidase 2
MGSASGWPSAFPASGSARGGPMRNTNHVKKGMPPMRFTRRKFLAATVVTTAGTMLPTGLSSTSKGDRLDAFEIAQRHLIVRDQPTPNFFEGMLLGNGDVGVCVTVRPDALGLHLGKSDAWDLRVSEDHWKYVLPFHEFLKLWERASDRVKRQGKPGAFDLEEDSEFRQYTQKVTSSYRKSWPRPCPCGLLWIHWDSRKVRVVRQSLDPSNGLLTIDLDCDDLHGFRHRVQVSCFVEWETGLISVSTDAPAPFSSLTYYSNLGDKSFLMPPLIVESGGDWPERGVRNDFAAFFSRQYLPAIAPTQEEPAPAKSARDSNFALQARLQGSWQFDPSTEPQELRLAKGQSWEEDRSRVSMRSTKDQPFRLDLLILTPRDSPENTPKVQAEVERLSQVPVRQLQQKTGERWKEFWSQSAVEFEDKDLERIWYHNQYWLACCLREGKVAPGLFGNWTSGNIGTAWHGDYHMNYNTQQVFWGVFSSNHVEQHLPYVDLCEKLLPMSEAYAKEMFGLPGAFFPHSAYPVPSQVMPYPAPPFGYEICETPWTVQSLWWQYLYTLDEGFLKRAYPLLRAAARFMAAYIKKESDGKYHIVPTVSPENWGCTVDFRLNKDCIMDLALTQFLLDAVVEASKALQLDGEERAKWAEIRANLAPYPKAGGPFGEVWLDVVNAPTEHVYNIPVTLAPVFPGEQVGMGRGEEQLEIARRTAQTIRLEGGNDLVYQPMIRARLGMLNLDWFKREVSYCLLPNGIANDRVRQVDGRYDDQTDSDFMMRMGVWTENLSLPAVLNECLMQSYTGTIRLFPNPEGLGTARFENLRAVGAFLVSATLDASGVSDVILLSEKGSLARVANPWPGRAVRVTRARDNQRLSPVMSRDIMEFPTTSGDQYRIEQAQ